MRVNGGRGLLSRCSGPPAPDPPAPRAYRAVMSTIPLSSAASPWDFAPLAKSLDGSLMTAGDPGWDEAGTLASPEAVVIPRSVVDITRVLDFAKRRGLRVMVQRTGTRAARPDNVSGTILLRTTALSNVSVDLAARTVRAEAGASWGQVDAALEPHGLVALAAGAEGDGVVGSVLDGDFGWLGREYGLTGATVSAIELVTGDGTHRRVSSTRDTDLYWALRGGGGSFGVVAAIELAARRHRAVHAGALAYPVERARDVVEAWEEWTRPQPDAVTTRVRLPVAHTVVVEGALTAGNADAALAPLRALLPVRDTFAPRTRPVVDRFAAAVCDGLVLERLDRPAIDVLVAAARSLDIEVRQLGGALGRPGPGALARVPGRFLLTVSSDAGREGDIRSVLDELAPWASAFELPAARQGSWSAERTHSPETLARLRAIRAAVDATSILRSARELG
jgi:hypothetical protein